MCEYFYVLNMNNFKRINKNLPLSKIIELVEELPLSKELDLLKFNINNYKIGAAIVEDLESNKEKIKSDEDIKKLKDIIKNIENDENLSDSDKKLIQLLNNIIKNY